MLEIKNINVNFFSKQVLKNVTLSFEEGKIHALFGENGAGKSTLARVLCGDLVPSSGEIFINNKKVLFKMSKDAIKKGICCVHQRPLLADSISIKENLLLGAGKLTDSNITKLISEYIPEKKISTVVQNLNGAQRFFVSLCCSLLKKPKVLILDEPTIFLDSEQKALLFTNLRKLATNGTTIIIITHNVKEILNFTDTTTFINEGIITNAFLKSITLSNISDFSLKIHKTNENNTKQKESKINQNIHFYVKYQNITYRPINKPSIFDISFDAFSNEITLIKGVKESGLESLEDAICGMTNTKFKGTILIQNQNENHIIKTEKELLLPSKLRNCKYNFAIIPSNKTFRASNPNLTVLQLVCCYKLEEKQKTLIEYTNKIIERAKIKATHNQKASTLSGGMLQRLILERELDTNPKILILCESLQGLDKDSSLRFCERIVKHASKGNAIIALHNSDFPSDLCNSIYTLESGICKKEK